MKNVWNVVRGWKPNLLVRIVIAIVLGVLAGLIAPIWLARGVDTFNGLFSEFLGFCIPLIILGFVAPAIAEVGAKAGKMLLTTAAIAYVFTFHSGLLGYGVGDWLYPGMISSMPMEHSAQGVKVAPYFSIDMPPLFGVTSALILAFVIGLGCAKVDSKYLNGMLGEFRTIIIFVIEKGIIPLLPVYIFSIFLKMTMENSVGSVLVTFGSIIGIIFALHILLLVTQFAIAAPFSPGCKNPFKLLRTMLPAYLTALGTQSSAATIPVTLNSTIKLGVNPDVAGFTVPLCATIHMSGSALKLTSCAVALMIMQGQVYDISLFIGFIAMLGVTLVASPGVPGGSVMAALGLFSSILGFSEADCALMIALYIAMDSFGTACNVTGDGAISIIISRIFSKSAKVE